MKNLFLIILLVGSILTHGQDFKSGTRYLSAQSNSEEYDFFDLDVKGETGDTMYLTYSLAGSGASKSYTIMGEKLYLEDSLLFFDFGVKAGDTIMYRNESVDTKIRVDSLKDLKLENGLVYTHFFAHHTVNGTKYTIIEGIGEMKTGLELFHLSSSPEDRVIISVCRNDSLIYWDTHGGIYKHKGEVLDTTCDYYGLAVGGSVGEQNVFPFSVYPNPTHNVLHLKNVRQADIRILDVLGAEVDKGVYENSLNVSMLPSGVYFLEFMKNKTMYRTKFYKE